MGLLANESWRVIERLPRPVLVVPVGATEQHGPHLPVTTDFDIAQALAERVHAAHPEAVAVAPAICFGASGEHQAFPGTLSVGQAALELYLLELGRSASCTWERVLLLSTHGGNHAPVRRAVAQLRREGRDVRLFTPEWPGDAHAGLTETSLMLAIAPNRVDTGAAVPGATEPLAALMPQLVAAGVASVSPTGILGDPTGACAEHGESLLTTATEALSALITNWPSDDQA